MKCNKRKGLKSIDFTTEANMWMYIICSRISPCGNVSDVPYVRALMIACIFYGILVNVGYYIIQEFKEYLPQDSPGLMFLVLKT